MTLLKKIKEYKEIQKTKNTYLGQQIQVARVMARSEKAKNAVAGNGIDNRLESRIKDCDLKLQEIKDSSILLRLLLILLP